MLFCLFNTDSSNSSIFDLGAQLVHKAAVSPYVLQVEWQITCILYGSIPRQVTEGSNIACFGML